MAAIARPTEATYVTHEQVTVDTSDHEDHTFCGIMFPVKCKELVPVDHIVITSVAVRGGLGPLTVWVSNEDDPAHQNQSFRLMSQHWTKIYEQSHASSMRRYCKLDLSANPIRLRPGQVRAVYIHSTLPGDSAIVYDNRRSRRTYDDGLLSLLPGRAHLSERPFGTTPIWGWGRSWRDEREFVGRVEFGAVYRLWNPNEFRHFGHRFQTLTRTLFLCQRRWESNMSRLPDDCIFYILNMCRWDWAGDTAETMKDLRRRRQAREMTAALEEGTAAANESQEAQAAQGEAQSGTCCNRVAVAAAEEDSDESEYVEEHDSGESEDDFYEDEHGNVYRVVDASEDVDVGEIVEEINADEEIDDVDELDLDEADEESDDNDADWDSDFEVDRHWNRTFTYRDDSDGEDETQDRPVVGRREWVRQFARIHVLHVLNARGNAMDESDA